MNIGRITILKVGGERAHKTAQFTYWPYHDTIRTQILYWSQRCGNRIFGTTVRFQPGQKPTVLCPVRVTNPPRHSGSGFWPGLAQNWTEPPANNRTAGGLPRPVANTSLQRVWWFCALSFWQGRQPSIWFSQSIARCLLIAAFTISCPGNSTPRFLSSRTPARGLLIRKYVSSIAARKNSPLAIVAIFKARRMSDCSSCIRPPWLAIVAVMLKTYKEISCCIYILDSAITSTIYASVASSNVVKAWLVHSRGFLSLNSSAKISELTTSWCSISHTVRTNALVNHGGFPIRVAGNWSRSTLRTPAARYIISWRWSTSSRLYSHPMACCFLFLLFPVVQTIFNCASRVMFSVAAFTASRWAKWCLRCS